MEWPEATLERRVRCRLTGWVGRIIERRERHPKHGFSSLLVRFTEGIPGREPIDAARQPDDLAVVEEPAVREEGPARV